jgi:hypothetical protein
MTGGWISRDLSLILNRLPNREDSGQQEDAVFRLWYPTIAVLAALTVSTSARGDVFLLRSGGQVEGDWANRNESTAISEVRTATGIRVQFASAQIEQRVPQVKQEAEYQRLAPTFGPSVEDQWKLAQWCRENGLPQHRAGHLEAILQLNPNHVGARRALGYRQHGNQWVTREEKNRSAGYELYRGRWRLTQDIEVQEEKSRRDLAETQWLVKLKRWRADLATDSAAQAYQLFEQLDDRLAVPALQKLLSQERQRKVKVLYLDALMRIGDAAAVQTLVQTALKDADKEIFLEAADRLGKLPTHRISKPLVDSLRDPDNVHVNRAAYVLGKTGDRRLVSPLVDALVRLHRTTVVPNGGDTTSFGGDGSFGLSRGNEPKMVEVPVQNQAVLEALVALTGQNFEYDQRAWRRWYDLERGRIFAEGGTDFRRDRMP